MAGAAEEQRQRSAIGGDGLEDGDGAVCRSRGRAAVLNEGGLGFVDGQRRGFEAFEGNADDVLKLVLKRGDVRDYFMGEFVRDFEKGNFVGADFRAVVSVRGIEEEAFAGELP